MMTRRELLTAGMALFASQVRAQTNAPPLVGALHVGAPTSETWRQFTESMRQLGYADGSTVRYAPRFAVNASLLNALAEELVNLAPRVILANGDQAARAVAARSATIPIVAQADDHIAAGLSDSYAHPTRNVTGLSRLEAELDTKRLELLHELVPSARRVLVLRDPETSGAARDAALADAAARAGVELDVRDITAVEAIDPAVAAGAADGARAILVLGSPLLAAGPVEPRIRLAAAAHRLAAMVQRPQDAGRGNLAGYGVERNQIPPRLAFMVDRIIKGAKPSEIPIERPTKFTFAVNLKVAKALGLEIPLALLETADEVIQ